MKNRRLTIVVGLVVMCTVVASLYAIADSYKSGCAPGACQMAAGAGCGQAAGGCAMKGGRGLSPAMTRGYSGGVVKLRVGACGTMVLAVLQQGNRPAPNASVNAELVSAAGRQTVAFRQVKPGVFMASPSVPAAGKLNVWVSGGGAVSDRVTFDVAAPTGAYGVGAGCTMKAGGCSMMGQGGCATMGACKQQGAQTAACKCDVCKCSPCQCK